jgi:hypothetical protein
VHEGLEKAIRSYVVELQQENKSKSKIYELLATMNPVLGDPLTFYGEFVIKYDESYLNAATSSAGVLIELTNKRKCHKLKQATTCNKQSKTPELMTPNMKVQCKQIKSC